MKKVLGIFLVLAMLLSFVPALEVAAAEETTWTKVESLADISETDTFAITITVGDNTYVLPVVEAPNTSASSKAIPEITCTVDGNQLTITNTEHTFGWKLIPTTGGYYIKSADDNGYYLYISGVNDGVSIYAKNPDGDNFVWNILTCNLLGANGGSKYHTLSVDMSRNGWWTPGTTGGTADGAAYSSARDNVLGLWKLNTAHTCEDLDPLDHNCDTCGTALTTCEDKDPLDHNCDTCGAPLTSCEDVSGDGDHNCDKCNKENITDHTDDPTDGDHKCDECADYEFGCSDQDENKICDECNAPLCGNEHQDDPTDGDHKCDICPVDNVTECEDSDTDADHNCDDCGKENITECVDSETDTDHNCDVCGKENMNECEDSETDKDHNCDVCGKENMNDCVDSNTDKDHDCDTCGKKDVSEHDWADATTAKPKTCKVCGKTEGDPLPTYHWVKVNSLSDISENDTFAITITLGGKTYVLPVYKSGNNGGSTAIPEIPGTIRGNKLIFTDNGYSYGWNLIPTEGGYYIRSADGNNYYLYIRPSNNGINIWAKEPKDDTKATYLWNILDCGLLGAADAYGDYRTLCVDGTLDPYQWGTYKIAEDGSANSKVRDNTLGLWKRVVGPADDYSSNTGDPITLTAAVMLVSGMSVVALIPKKKD